MCTQNGQHALEILGPWVQAMQLVQTAGTSKRTSTRFETPTLCCILSLGGEYVINENIMLSWTPFSRVARGRLQLFLDNFGRVQWLLKELL